MAERKDLLTRLADAGEDAISRFSKAPGGEQLSGFAHTMRERIDELQKKVRGIDDLERRIEALEKRVDALAKPKRRARATTAKKPAASRTSAPTSTSSRSTSHAGGTSPG
jgi:hypothetical protein